MDHKKVNKNRNYKNRKYNSSNTIKFKNLTIKEIESALVDKDLVKSLPDQQLIDWIEKLVDSLDSDSLIRVMSEESEIYNDIADTTRGKRNREYIMEIVGNEFTDVFDDDDNNLLKTIRYLQLMILTDSYQTIHHIPKMKKVGDKIRPIISPDFEKELIIQHSVIRVLLPRLTKGSYYYSCGFPGKGLHFAKESIWNAMETDIRGTRYVFQLDIRHFFDTIPHRFLKRCIKKLTKDPNIRRLLYKILDTQKVGVPQGFFTSGWLANYFLQEFDHYVKERILDDIYGKDNTDHKYHGAKYMWRYFDDILIMHPNKRELVAMKNKIFEILKNDFGLTVKYNWQIFQREIDHNGKTTGRVFDYLGFRFHAHGVTVRKRTYKKIMKLIKILKHKKIYEITFHEACCMVSYYGVISWTDAMSIYTKLLRPYVRLKDLKNIIRKEQKKLRELHPHLSRFDKI